MQSPEHAQRIALQTWSSAASPPAPPPPTPSMPATARRASRCGSASSKDVSRSESEEVGAAAVRRPALGDRRVLGPVRRSAGDLGRALPGDGARSARGPVCRPRAAGIARARRRCRSSTAPTMPSPIRPSFARGRWKRKPRRLALRASPIRAAPARALRQQRSRSRPRAASPAPIARAATAARHRWSRAKAAGMQRDSAWHSARHLDDLEAAADIGRRAGERAVARLESVAAASRANIRCCSTRASPPTLLGHFAGAISGARRSRARPASSRTSSASSVFAPGRHDRRRSAAPARPALAAVRWRRAARRPGGSW